jgi:two-component system, LytTR family, sensor kinase
MKKRLMDWYLRFYPTVGTPPNRRIKIHVYYWLCYFVFSFFSVIHGVSFGDRIVVAFHLVLLGSILYYFLAYLALPLLFDTKKFYLGIFFILLTYVLQHLEKLGFNTLVLKYNIHPPNGFTLQNVQDFVKDGVGGMLRPKNVFREIFFASQALMIPFFLKFSRMLLFNSINNKKIMLEKSKVEIDLLRSQINPHFLLNTINNIYSQIVTKDETAPDSIIALSDLMKYLLHQAKEPSIGLQQEISFIESYINWEKLKDNNKNIVNFQVIGDLQDLKIAPLLLINFIENAFKHVGHAANEKGLIDIQINVKDAVFEFMIANTKGIKSVSSSKKAEGGLGLKNVTQRLNVLYPQNHKLFFQETDALFTVHLSIHLHQLMIQHEANY